MKILLVCNAGMSSSILIDKVKAAANARGIALTISASPIKGLDEEKGLWDLCMVGPQISYAIERIKTLLEIPVLAIDPRVYALADGEGALDLAIKLYQTIR